MRGGKELDALMAEQSRSNEATREMSKRMVSATNHGAAVKSDAAGKTNRDKQDDRREVQARDNTATDVVRTLHAASKLWLRWGCSLDRPNHRSVDDSRN